MQRDAVVEYSHEWLPFYVPLHISMLTPLLSRAHHTVYGMVEHQMP